ncbi:mechanosensitive ion channel family protein [Nioella sediminis]|jgi:small-conductance mechanosensitive channel|uniref:mechanosensitive ion channel family protein n=1 Tax=Nioella sediminis TaxID=1912092 RepID=UPI0009F80F3B|nr:mechanosensitive ion channel domain-containing protein [Nioella sediminis]
MEPEETAPPATPEAATETPVDASENLADIGLSLFGQAQAFLESLLRPWNAYQLAIAAGLLLAAWLLRKVFGPRIRAWMAARQGWPMWRMRILAFINKRIMGIFFVLLIWLTVWIMREVTWPSRSYMLGIIARLATAWLIVTFVTRFVHSPIMRTILRYGAWIYVTLSITSLTDEAATLLDSVGFDLGEGMRLSLLLVVQGFVLVSALLIGARFLSKTTATRIQKNEDISPSMRVLVIKAVQVVLYGAALFVGLNAVGVDLTGLAFLSGAIGVGLGFGLQKVVSNLVSGIIILLDKSIKPGDVISLGDTFGWINTLGARYASVVTRDGKEYLIPNEDLITNQVVNWSHSDAYVRLDIHFGTSYTDDPHKVRQLAIDAARSVDRVLSHKAPVCHIVGFGDSSVDYVLRFWIEDPTGGLTNIRGNVFLALWDTFHEHGISIPFPQREVRMLPEAE